MLYSGESPWPIWSSQISRWATVRAKVSAAGMGGQVLLGLIIRGFKHPLPALYGPLNPDNRSVYQKLLKSL